MISLDAALDNCSSLDGMVVVLGVLPTGSLWAAQVLERPARRRLAAAQELTTGDAHAHTEDLVDSGYRICSSLGLRCCNRMSNRRHPMRKTSSLASSRTSRSNVSWIGPVIPDWPNWGNSSSFSA